MGKHSTSLHDHLGEDIKFTPRTWSLLFIEAYSKQWEYAQPKPGLFTLMSDVRSERRSLGLSNTTAAHIRLTAEKVPVVSRRHRTKKLKIALERRIIKVSFTETLGTWRNTYLPSNAQLMQKYWQLISIISHSHEYRTFKHICGI